MTNELHLERAVDPDAFIESSVNHQSYAFQAYRGLSNYNSPKLSTVCVVVAQPTRLY